MYTNDNRTVITLDAGGTTFVFGAIKGTNFVMKPITLPVYSNDLDRCLESVVNGFQKVIDSLDEKPVAISFAFPGPADYPNGIIGGYLPNFPSFRNGVALGPFLESKFKMPVFINNDGNLYAYGEALAGMLPEINCKLSEYKSAKQFKNLIGYTLGTGFGMGLVLDGNLHLGDNSCCETFCLRNKKYPDTIVEDSVSIRAVERVYKELSGDKDSKPNPKEIFEIAEGKRDGNAEAAIKSFEELGEVAGDAIATAVTIFDGLVVIGGGLIGARKYIMPALLKEMRGKIKTMSGDSINRLQVEVFDLDDKGEFHLFANGNKQEIPIYGTDKRIICDPMKRIGVATTKIGTSQAISMGAYNFALNQLDKK